MVIIPPEMQDLGGGQALQLPAAYGGAFQETSGRRFCGGGQWSHPGALGNTFRVMDTFQ